MKNIKKEKRNKNLKGYRMVRTLESTRRAFSRRAELLRSLTRRSMYAILFPMVLDWVEAMKGPPDNTSLFIESD